MHPFHDLDWAGRTGHDARAQTSQIKLGKVWVLKLGDEHGGDSVQGGALLLLHRFQHSEWIKGRTRIHHSSPMCQTPQITHHHPKAMIQRHRNTQPVLIGQFDGLSNEIAIVENVLMGEAGAFGLTRRPRGELDIDDIIKLQLRSRGLDTLDIVGLRQRTDIIKIEHTRCLR